MGEDGKCRALALRGGGTKGAFEVGVLKAITELLEPIDYQYDVVVGVSIGAINGAMFATFAKGDEKAAVEKLEEVWNTYTAEDFWRLWPTVNVFGGLY